MDLMPLANRLEFKVLGEQGKTLFVHFMPVECEQGILLRSPYSGTRINYELPGYYKTEFSAIVRVPSTNIENGNALMSEVVKVLTISEAKVENMRVKFIRPIAMPMIFPVSDGNYVEIMTRFSAAFTIE